MLLIAMRNVSENSYSEGRKVSSDYFHFNNHASEFQVLSLKNKLQKCVRNGYFSPWVFEISQEGIEL